MIERPATPRTPLPRGGCTAVLGLGLMGGSFARAVRRAGLARRILGYDVDRAVRARARESGAIDEAAASPAEAVAGASLVVLAAPVRAILMLLDEIEPHLEPGALVLDLGSTKRGVVERLGRLPEAVRAVGGHPMCGKEVAGLAHADADLFHGAAFALCPTARTDGAAREEATALVANLGARPLWLDPDAHDRAVAAVSHLPYLLSISLVQTVMDTADEEAWSLAASGFRDTSRLAASDLRMMLDILGSNADAVAAALAAAEATLARLRSCVEQGDEETLAKLLERAAQRRRDWRG